MSASYLSSKLSIYLRCFLLGLLAFLGAPVLAQLPPDTTISAVVAPDKVVIGEKFSYSVVIIGSVGQQDMKLPDLSTVPQLEQLGGVSQHSQFTTVNGVSRTEFRYSVALRAKETGTFTIPPAKLQFQGRWHDTNSVTVTVSDVPTTELGSTSIISGRTQSPDINRQLEGKYFALSELPEKIYAGQAVPLKIYVYRHPTLPPFVQWQPITDITGSDWIQAPQQEDLTSRSVRWERVQLDGQDFERTHLYTKWIVPTKQGSLLLNPPSTQVYLEGRRRSTRNIEDMMFGAPLVEVELQVRAKRVEVLAPPPKPDGAVTQVVGNIMAAVTSDRLDKATGRASVPQRELLSIKITIAGEGFLDTVVTPQLPPLTGLSLLDEKKSTLGAIEGDRYVSSKEFDLVFQATAPGETEVPALTFAMFNPTTGEQSSIVTPAIPITVVAGSADAVLIGAASTPGEASTPGAPARADAKTLGADVAYIDASPLTTAGVGAFRVFYAQPWFWVLQLLPLAAAVGFGLMKLRAEALAVDTEERRADRIRKQIAAAVEKARKSVESAKRDEFYALLANGALEFVGLQLKRSPKGLTAEVAEEELRRAGSPVDACARLKSFLEMCASIRYSPAVDSPEARRAALSEAEHILASLGTNSGARS
jgi:hypothetical protein